MSWYISAKFLIRADVAGGGMEGSLENERKNTRREVVAHFDFVVDGRLEDVCEGIVINISRHAVGFLTQQSLSEGQIITVMEKGSPSVAILKARVLWVKKGTLYYQVGAKVIAKG
jgi:hypothetical protein